MCPLSCPPLAASVAILAHADEVILESTECGKIFSAPADGKTSRRTGFMYATALLNETKFFPVLKTGGGIGNYLMNP